MMTATGGGEGAVDRDSEHEQDKDEGAGSQPARETLFHRGAWGVLKPQKII